MFWLRNKKSIFWYALLNKGLIYIIKSYFHMLLVLAINKGQILFPQVIFVWRFFCDDLYLQTLV